VLSGLIVLGYEFFVLDGMGLFEDNRALGCRLFCEINRESR